MRQRKLGIKALMNLAALAMLLVIFTCLTVGIQYWRERMQEYSDMAFSYARTAVDYIDGDKVLSYVETNREDDYYRQVRDFLNASLRQTDLKYYYVFVPYEDDLVYVWDAGEGEGVQSLGYHESYMEGGKKAIERIYRQDPPEEISVAQDEVYGYIVSAYSPVFNSEGEPVAVVGVDLSMPGIRRALFGFLITVALSIAAVILIFMGIFYTFIRKNIVVPVGQLNEAVNNMVGNLEREDMFRLQIHTGDEIEELAQSFGQMALELRDYIVRLSTVTAEKERIGAELDIATHIQSSMLPCIFPAFPERKEFDIHATMNPAKEVGGDFYDFFMVDDTHIAVVVADVSGKGVPAALFMVIGKTLIKDHTQPGTDLGEVFTQVNELLCMSNSEGLFITAFEGVLDLVTGELVYVNAGHEIPLICRKNGAFQEHRIRAGFVLAGMEGMRYKAGKMQLEPGDKLFQYTDGVTEATNAGNELFGMERLRNILDRSRDCPPKELLLAVKEGIDGFVGDAPQFDDITMLCLEYKGYMGGLQ